MLLNSETGDEEEYCITNVKGITNKNYKRKKLLCLGYASCTTKYCVSFYRHFISQTNL